MPENPKHPTLDSQDQAEVGQKVPRLTAKLIASQNPRKLLDDLDPETRAECAGERLRPYTIPCHEKLREGVQSSKLQE